MIFVDNMYLLRFGSDTKMAFPYFIREELESNPFVYPSKNITIRAMAVWIITAITDILSRIMVYIVTKAQALDGLLKHKKEQWDNLEKILITIVASGFLAGSIALISSSKNGTFLYTQVLVISWIAFAACLVFLISSYAILDVATSLFIENIKGRPDNAMIDLDKEVESHPLYFVVNLCKYLSIFSVLTGICVLVYFGYLNFF